LAWCDAINTWWNDRVLIFDYRAQLNLLSRLGIHSPDLEKLGWCFVGALLVWLGWMAWQFGRGAPRVRPDRLGRAYARLCKKLARAGVPRAAHEGPVAYADMVGKERPDLAPEVKRLLARYAELRYGVPPARAQLYEAEIKEFELGVGALVLSSST
jgi:hypothetical protein